MTKELEEMYQQPQEVANRPHVQGDIPNPSSTQSIVREADLAAATPNLTTVVEGEEGNKAVDASVIDESGPVPAPEGGSPKGPGNPADNPDAQMDMDVRTQFGPVWTAGEQDYEDAPGLISVRKFVQRFLTLFEHQDFRGPVPDWATEEDPSARELVVSDVKVETPFDQAQRLIAEEFGEQDDADMLKGPSQAATEVLEAMPHRGQKLVSLRDREVARKEALKARRKEVNYVTDSMRNEPRVSETFSRPVSVNEPALSIAFYHHHKQMKVQEFLVLGSQTLLDLRKCLYCVSDLTGKDRPSSTFFIENTFYNDTASEKHIDISEPIREWMKQPKTLEEHPEWQNVTAKDMAQTRFIDLSIRIGHPYVYMHQGDCEHTLVFTNVRLTNESDPKESEAYPVQTFQSKIRRMKCRICDIYPAKQVTFRDRLAPDNPCYFCNQCYHRLHFSKENILLYRDFNVYPYEHE